MQSLAALLQKRTIVDPGRLQNYVYPHLQGEIVVNEQVEVSNSVAENIGQGIHAGCSCWQKYRIISLAAATLCFIGSAIAHRNPQAPAGINTLTIAALVHAAYAIYKGDLNSSRERRQVCDRIAQQKFSEIAESYTQDRIEKFDLLEGIVGHLNNLQQQNILYQKFADIRAVYEQAKTQYKQDIAKVEALYYANGGYLEQKLMKTVEHVDADGKTHQETTYPDTTPTSKRLPVLFATRGQKMLTKWVDWRAAQLADIDAKYKASVASINDAFQALKDALPAN